MTSGSAGLFPHGRTTASSDITAALTTKSGGIFVLCGPDGDIDAHLNNSHGLYFHDTRFLDCATLRLEQSAFSVLLARGEKDRSISELANVEFGVDGGQRVPAQRIAVRRQRTITDRVVENLTVRNHADEAVDLSLILEFAAGFEDMLSLRGANAGRRGQLHDPRWADSRLVFEYHGADSRQRTTTLGFSPAPDECAKARVRYSLCLLPGQSAGIAITIEVADKGQGRLEISPTPSGQPVFDRVTVQSDSDLFNAVLARSFDDLTMLLTQERGEMFFSAGIPWYAALFGRDSIITALETLPYDANIAANTLQLLATYQGRSDDTWREEEPGKILHELRIGEKANLNEVPQTPYYGTVDATPLFIILMAEYVRWTGDLELWHRLRPNIERALAWIDKADHDSDGFIDYRRRSSSGLENQGWKDSANSVRNRDGSNARPPIALVEVQAYAYRARREAAWLFLLDGERELAAAQAAEATTLRRRFRRAYWMADRHYLAEAIQDGGTQAGVVTSNAGHALWAGILDDDQAAPVAKRLMQADLHNGWGIRTMSELEAAYNPLDYQVGAVWPHDSAIIAAGLHRHGFVSEGLSVFSSILRAAEQFPLYRLPELFAGYSRDEFAVPVKYPVACNPQAWSAGAIPYMLASLLGLRPDAPGGVLEIVSPVLPFVVDDLIIEAVRVGNAAVTLHYRRATAGTTVHVEGLDGALDVRLPAPVSRRTDR